MKFYKYHALGNDYIVIDPGEFEIELRNIGLPRKEVSNLTRLFEQARYGDIDLGLREREEASTCLEAIVRASEGAA